MSARCKMESLKLWFRRMRHLSNGMPPSKASSDNSTPLKNFQLVFFLLFAVGFMVQGWGDRSALLNHPARTGVLVIFALSTLILLFIPFDPFAGGRKEVFR